MTISAVSYKSDTNLFNHIYNNPSVQTTQKEGSLPVENSNKKELKTSQKALYMGAGVATILLGLVTLFSKKFGKFMKSLLAFAENKMETPKFTAVSLPDNRKIDVEVVDTNFLSPKSKLRMKPEIVDAEFEEII